MRASALSQGLESRLLVFGVDEEQSGFGFGALGFLLSSVPVDAWVIIGVLALMMVQTWVVMFQKFRQARRTDEANAEFRDAFAGVGTRLEVLADDRDLGERLAHSSLWRLYQVAVRELRVRREQGADTDRISSETLEAIRASMDAVRTNENRALGHRLGVLSNAIAGGPYIGLLGTVLGIMVVFLGTAMAGNVNINAVARAWPRPAGHGGGSVRRYPGAVCLQPPERPQSGNQLRHARVPGRVRDPSGGTARRRLPHSPSVADDLPVGRRDALA
ncbi:MotA/TolQ/ExbB proton channel family protein [Alcanivorax sp. IO_7]|nr:MotA/TolQ/ExbB proton channel family protein [Alcanivorax sp. IO_7]